MIRLIPRLLALSSAIALSIASGADNNPPTEASIKELLQVGRAHEMLDAMVGQIDSYMKQAMQQATQGQHIAPDIQKQIDRFETEMAATMKEILDWDKLEPMYVRVYQKSLTQQDVDGMIAFYRTPAGQALITKMPVIMQNTMNEMQQMVQPMMQRIQRMQHDIVAQIQAEKKKSGG